MTDETLDQDQLRELAARTAQLPREIEPPEDAWLSIKSAIDRSQNTITLAFWQKPAFLAAAALILVAGSSIATAVALRGRADPSARVVSYPVDGQHPEPSTALTLAEFTKQENDYISTANRLSAMLESEQMQLSPHTIAKMKESVRIIDEAILEARRALAEDPGNHQLMEMLSTSYSQKVDFLRRTTEMGRS